MEPKTKQYLLVTVVGVTLFVALLRLSAVLAFAAELVDLILPILAGGILALFLSVPMAGLEKRLRSLFRRAKKQPWAAPSIFSAFSSPCSALFLCWCWRSPC